MKPINFIILFLLLVGCAKSKLTNFHYGKYTDNKVNIDKILKIRVSTLSIPKQTIIEEKTKTFFDLRDSVPNRFLIEIGAKSTKPEDIINAIKSPLSTVDKKPAEIIKTLDESEVIVRFLFSNIKKYYNDVRFIHPNSRLEILNTTLSIKDNFFSIKAIDRIENEIDFIDFGTLEREQTVKFGSKLNAGLSSTIGSEINDNYSNKLNNGTTSNNNNSLKYGEEITNGNSNSVTNGREVLNTNSIKNTAGATKNLSGELTYNNDEIIKEALVGKLQRMKVGLSFDEKEIELSQHGSILTDVVDNIVLTATLKAGINITTSKSINQFNNFYHKKSGRFNHPDSISASSYKLKYIPCKNSNIKGINAEINAEGLFRAVLNTKNKANGAPNGQSVYEFDDRVDYFVLDTALNPVKITIPNYTFCKEIYQISCLVDGKEDDDYYYLFLKKPYDFMCFFTAGEQLVELESWLNFAIKQKELPFFKSKISLSFKSLISGEEIVLTGENPSLEAISKIKEIKVKDFIDQ